MAPMWKVTYMSNDSKGSLIGTSEYEFKAGAVKALWRHGKPSHITRVRRSYTVSVNKSR